MWVKTLSFVFTSQATSRSAVQAHRDGPGRNVEARQHEVDARPGDVFEMHRIKPTIWKKKSSKYASHAGGREGRKESALDRRNERRGRQSLHACQTSLTLTEPVSTVVQHAMLQAAYGGRRDRRVQAVQPACS